MDGDPEDDDQGPSHAIPSDADSMAAAWVGTLRSDRWGRCGEVSLRAKMIFVIPQPVRKKVRRGPLRLIANQRIEASNRGASRHANPVLWELQNVPFHVLRATRPGVGRPVTFTPHAVAETVSRARRGARRRGPRRA